MQAKIEEISNKMLYKIWPKNFKILKIQHL